MRHRTAVVAGAVLLAALAFVAGILWSRRALGPAPSDAPPVVALDAGAVDLGPGRPLRVEWDALTPPSAPLPAPASPPGAAVTASSTRAPAPPGFPAPPPPPRSSAPPLAPAR